MSDDFIQNAVNALYQSNELMALKAENARLKAENARLKAEIERLTKAGDAMDGVLGLPINAVQEFELHQAWFVAKGGQS